MSAASAFIHPLIVRLTHWLNAVAVIVMIGSGWQIYNAYPILPFKFPAAITLGGWLGGALLWHFAAMWLLAVNGLIYVGFGIASGRFRRKFWPIRPREIIADIASALRGKLDHGDLSTYNAVQKLLYVGVLAALAVVILSGVAIWKPVQLFWLAAVFGGFEIARVVHFLAMAAIAGFLGVHIVMALLVPKTLRAMIGGAVMLHQPDVEARLLVKDAARLLDNRGRRAFLRGALGLGSLTLLTGCDVTTDTGAESALRAISSFNDRIQAWLFNPNVLAEEFPASAITDPFPFNAFYKEEEAPEVEAEDFALAIGGMADTDLEPTLADLNAMPQVSQITRHICIEGWSAIGKWSGVRFSDFLERIGADKRARYVGFRCADGYSTSLDMATALHPQTQLTLRFGDQVLPRKYGFPMKLRVPTKLGFKNPKHITEIFVTNEYPGGFWEKYGYNWFSGL